MSGYESSAIELNFLILDYKKHITTRAQEWFHSKWCSLSLFNTCPSGLWIQELDKTPNLAVALIFSFFLYRKQMCEPQKPQPHYVNQAWFGLHVWEEFLCLLSSAAAGGTQHWLEHRALK